MLTTDDIVPISTLVVKVLIVNSLLIKKNFIRFLEFLLQKFK